jgi:hypothetical protein
MQPNGHVRATGKAGKQIAARAGGAKEAEPPAIDLAAWGRGEAKAYTFDEVQRAIDDYILAEIDEWVKTRFVMATDPAEAVRFLIEEGIIDAEEARTDLDEDE